MKIDLTKVSYDAKWFDFGDARLKIRPFPMSQQDVAIKDGAIIMTGDNGQKRFVYCLTEMENVPGADGKPLPCTSEVKKTIYDFRLGIIKGTKGEDICMSDFVLLKTNEMAQEIVEASKN
ncbi:MAG: hypothetical protein ABFD50_18905 [Smithella sp.]